METKHRIHPIILAHAREMRHPQTPAEASLWRALRNRKTGFKLRRQHPIYRFIIDFYCAQAKLLIEIDGKSHLEPDQVEYDRARTESLEKLGYKVIRFTNNDVRYNIHTVADEILRTIEARIAELKSKKQMNSPRTPALSPLGERGKD
jgi:very-short-patch-repair endonuclease